jgi:hypothetical protein
MRASRDSVDTGLLGAVVEPPALTPARKITGRVVAVMTATGQGKFDFCGHNVTELDLDFEGIVGNRHRGATRRADARVPYLKRGTEMRNTRHLSIVSVEDCAEIARKLDLASFDPAWIGANVVVSGIGHWSYVPRASKLIFDGAAILTVEDQNAPCRRSGEAIVRAIPTRPDIQSAFPKQARGLRGIVATVEHPGKIAVGCAFTARIPEQWIYS